MATWFFKVTYENVALGEQWFGPFDDEQSAITRKDEIEALAAAAGRTDTCSTPAEIADPRPSPVIMVVSRVNTEGQYVDWEIHEDGTENLRA